MLVHTKRVVDTPWRVQCATGFLARRGDLDWEGEVRQDSVGASGQIGEATMVPSVRRVEVIGRRDEAERDLKHGPPSVVDCAEAPPSCNSRPRGGYPATGSPFAWRRQ
jgi:hypothetical protein